VARPRPRRAMRPPLAVRLARICGFGGTANGVWRGRGRRSHTPGRVSRSGLDRSGRDRIGRGDTQRDARTRAGAQSPHSASADPECRGAEAQEFCLGNNHADPAAQGDRQGVRHHGSERPDRGQGQSSTSSAAGISGAPGLAGSSVESGLTADAIRVHRAVCHRYPQVKTFFGKRASGGYHGQSRALDCIISDSTVGWEIAKVGSGPTPRAWAQWRSSTGSTSGRCSRVWRAGAQCRTRGSPTANHMDHVHVSVYGNSGTA
jgi:hypothetical protein